MRVYYTLALVPAAIGAVLGAVACFAPGTGVTGTAGAILALIGAVAATVGSGLALAVRMPRGIARTLDVLTLFAAMLTAIAAYFLMQTMFATTMLLACVGLIAAATLSGRRIGR